MKISEQTTKGVRLKNMPKAWFQVPSDQAMKNTMTAAVGVYTYIYSWMNIALMRLTG